MEAAVKTEEKRTEKNAVFHDMNTPSTPSFLTPKVIGLFVGVIVAGIIVGYGISRIGGPAVGGGSTGQSGESVAKGTVYGSNDTATFKDTAEGVVKTGGIDGEGQYHLVRPGGDSQNVYMTSSLVDMSKFIDKKVKVWGQTQAAQHAGWLMDVGRVEVE